MGPSRQRHDNARHPSGNTAIESYAKALAERHGLNPKTVAKWKKRTFVHDAPMGPKDRRSTVLSIEEGAIAVACRSTMPLRPARHHPESHPLIASSLLSAPRHQPAAGCRKSKATSLPKRRFRKYPISYFHIDIAEVRTEEGKLYVFVDFQIPSRHCYDGGWRFAARAV